MAHWFVVDIRYSLRGERSLKRYTSRIIVEASSQPQSCLRDHRRAIVQEIRIEFKKSKVLELHPIHSEVTASAISSTAYAHNTTSNNKRGALFVRYIVYSPHATVANYLQNITSPKRW